jgi:hypothetical protein
MVGNVALGSEHPIRVQTMTTTDTTDVKATVDQVFSSSICCFLNHNYMDTPITLMEQTYDT